MHRIPFFAVLSNILRNYVSHSKEQSQACWSSESALLGKQITHLVTERELFLSIKNRSLMRIFFYFKFRFCWIRSIFYWLTAVVFVVNIDREFLIWIIYTFSQSTCLSLEYLHTSEWKNRKVCYFYAIFALTQNFTIFLSVLFFCNTNVLFNGESNVVIALMKKMHIH